MHHSSSTRQFYHFVLPTMLTMLLTGLYTIIDGFFIGRATQDVGLAAIGLVWPIAAVLIAVGTGIGSAGAVVMSACEGAGYPEEGARIKAETITLLLLSSLILTTVFVLFCPQLIRFLGAKGAIYDAALEYIQVIAWGGSMQILACGLTPIIRNSRLSLQAMMIMIAGLISNIVLDAFFTIPLPWGLRGAAIATTLSQGLTVVFAVLILLRKTRRFSLRDMKLRSGDVRQILPIAIAPFGLSLMPSFVTIFNNWQCLNYGGASAVSAYSVMNYYVSCVTMLLSGIGEGVQPLISYYHGAKQEEALNFFRKKALVFAAAVAFVFFLLSFWAGAILAELFSTSDQTGRLVQQALPLLGLSFGFTGIVRIYSSYFYARKNPRYANLLVYLDPCVFTPLALLILPPLLELNGVWLSLFSTQAVSALCLFFLLRRQKKETSSRCRS